MKFSRLTSKLGELLSAERRRQRQKRDKLKALLKEMKRQQKDLETTLVEEQDPTRRAALELRLQILVEQRKKGIRLRKSLR